MTALAMGPRTAAPSWTWVGDGTAAEMQRYFDVSIFDDFEHVPEADLILIIKARPPVGFVANAAARGTRVFFAPIDIYQDETQIAADAEMLKQCEAVLLHSEPLRHWMAPFCRRIARVEHHARFMLDHLADFNDEGFLLWVGAFQHLPHVLSWLDQRQPPLEVRLLTDLNSRSARIAGHQNAYRLGLSLKLKDGRINGYCAQQWSEALQAQMMGACKAAIDIKGDSFNQSMKPPTKAQQFIASGVPFGCNQGHPALAHFRAQGFELVAADFERLLSREYWLETQAFAVPLRSRLSLHEIGVHYREILTLSAAGLACV